MEISPEWWYGDRQMVGDLFDILCMMLAFFVLVISMNWRWKSVPGYLPVGLLRIVGPVGTRRQRLGYAGSEAYQGPAR